MARATSLCASNVHFVHFHHLPFGFFLQSHSGQWLEVPLSLPLKLSMPACCVLYFIYSMSLPYSQPAKRWLCLRPVFLLLTPSGLPTKTLETLFSWQKLTAFVVALCRRSLILRLLRSMIFLFAFWIFRHFFRIGMAAL